MLALVHLSVHVLLILRKLAADRRNERHVTHINPVDFWQGNYNSCHKRFYLQRSSRNKRSGSSEHRKMVLACVSGYLSDSFCFLTWEKVKEGKVCYRQNQHRHAYEGCLNLLKKPYGYLTLLSCVHLHYLLTVKWLNISVISSQKARRLLGHYLS